MSATIPTPTQTLSQMKTTELRQLASKVYGIKGMSSARKDDLVTAITAKVEAEAEAKAAKTFTNGTLVETPKDGRGVVKGEPVRTATGYVVNVVLERSGVTPTGSADYNTRDLKVSLSTDAKRAARTSGEAAKNARKVGAAPKTRKATDRPKCEVCGKRRVDRRTQGLDSTMCQVCYEYAGEENRHTDQDHEGTYAITGSGDQDCPVCQDAGYNAKRDASAPHAKALRFEADAKAAGWNALARTAPAPVSSTEVVTSIVTARKGDQELTIIWDGASCRNTGTTHKGPDGKVRKVRNASAARKILASV